MVDGKISSDAWPDLESLNKGLYDALDKHMAAIKENRRKTAENVLKVLDDFFDEHDDLKPEHWETIKTNFIAHAINYSTSSKTSPGVCNVLSDSKARTPTERRALLPSRATGSCTLSQTMCGCISGAHRQKSTLSASRSILSIRESSTGPFGSPSSRAALRVRLLPGKRSAHPRARPGCAKPGAGGAS
ncbi:hypothetical protein BCR44DRAFT_1429303 [Catenaria anguillulae PL171]|uniref:Uncharacterized protein n=1 Tax=Catenaria anguillulae PL171 TaxID=765915 RepID=A0A1Y2HW61_9FUNG|nr:hypothetical protein BCR44DRAFT_1429303 [Catenaria anguillulae PL171]